MLILYVFDAMRRIETAHGDATETAHGDATETAFS